WTMLFSRIDDPPSFLRTEIARTAIGIDALTVSPARSPRYTVDAPKTRPKSTPRTMAFGVNSGSVWDAGTEGLNAAASVVSRGVGMVCAMPQMLALEPCESFEQAQADTR